MKYAALASLGLVLGLAAGGCPNPTTGITFGPGTYMGTVTCTQNARYLDGSQDPPSSYSLAYVFKLYADGSISIQEQAYAVGTVFMRNLGDGGISTQTVGTINQNNTHIVIGSAIQILGGAADGTTGTRTIDLKMTDTGDIVVRDNTVQSGSLVTTTQDCGGTLNQ